jgi:hypothetical protein
VRREHEHRDRGVLERRDPVTTISP